MSTIVLRDGVVFDGHSPELLDGADVLIEDGEIKAVSERPLRTAGAQEIRLGGRFLMPGLIDAHFHAYAARVNLPSLDDWPMSLFEPTCPHAAGRLFCNVALPAYGMRPEPTSVWPPQLSRA